MFSAQSALGRVPVDFLEEHPEPAGLLGHLFSCRALPLAAQKRAVSIRVVVVVKMPPRHGSMYVGRFVSIWYGKNRGMSGNVVSRDANNRNFTTHTSGSS